MATIKVPYRGKCTICERRRVLVGTHYPYEKYGAVCRPCDKWLTDRRNALFPTWPQSEYAA